jgi:Asp-tRNA(Asn)/Glu-tRNA(Gln) amidotransferase A subunit family amidase
MRAGESRRAAIGVAGRRAMSSGVKGLAVTRPLNELALTEAAEMIAAGLITSEELVRACLDRIASREDDIHAWAALDPEHALAQARNCDSGPVRGPLHGVPVGVKDVLDTVDFPTQMGSPIFADHQSRSDASCVSMLRAAGAVILGKTITCEFAGIAPGPTQNPIDRERTPGGSSSGSGAAVADYMVPLALGTQTGGSVLRPASFCGVFGFKPTFGIINRAGLKFAAESLDTIGLLARRLEDIALCLHVLTNSARPVSFTALDRPRIGICRTHLWQKAQPETRAALDYAARLAARAGANVEEFTLPPSFVRLSEARETINNVERSRSLAWEWANHRQQISVQMSQAIKNGQSISDEQYHAALRFAERSRQELDHILDSFDILLAPCVSGEAPMGLAYAGDPSFQGLWTLLHVPTLSIPAIRGPNGMPVGIQVIAKRFSDHSLLNCAQWLVLMASLDGTKSLTEVTDANLKRA